LIKVSIIALGKLKDDFLRNASGEYQKRLSRYCDLSVNELTPAFLPENPSKLQVESALESESQLIQKAIPKNAVVIALCVEGKQFSSEEFSEKIEEIQNEGRPICFLIGSSYGLSSTVKNFANIKLSVSKMTFPHQLFRILLLEQIYRGFKIIEGSTYHK